MNGTQAKTEDRRGSKDAAAVRDRQTAVRMAGSHYRVACEVADMGADRGRDAKARLGKTRTVRARAGALALRGQAHSAFDAASLVRRAGGTEAGRDRGGAEGFAGGRREIRGSRLQGPG